MVVAAFSSVGEKPARPSASSLLEATPPVLVYALSTAYPLLRVADRVLGWLTWTSRDQYESVLLVVAYVTVYKNFTSIVRNWLPLAFAASLSLLAYRHMGPAKPPPTLDEIMRVLEGSGRKYRQFVAPLHALDMSGTELVKLVLATLFLSPVYIVISHFWLTPGRIVLGGGVAILTWHSLWFKVLRSVAWRFSATRFLAFVLTGVDRANQAGNQYKTELKRSLSQSSLTAENVSFTFVVFENQRHWLGAGWTANLLGDERAPWTDPALSEVPSIDTFELPDAEGTGMVWKWVDRDWKLDLSNGGLLGGSENGSGLVPRPLTTDSQGFIYTNGFWSSPAAYEGFSKYTRRRRWVRKAALVPDPTTDPTTAPSAEIPLKPTSNAEPTSNTGPTANAEPTSNTEPTSSMKPAAGARQRVKIN